MKISIEELFKYHPPLSETRKQKHNAINDVALQFAKTVEDLVVDEDCKKMAYFAIQQARMFANQGITIDDLESPTLTESKIKELNWIERGYEETEDYCACSILEATTGLGTFSIEWKTNSKSPKYIVRSPWSSFNSSSLVIAKSMVESEYKQRISKCLN